MAPPAAGLTLKAAPSAKQYTVAALAAALAMAAVITVFFVVLCPAHLAFSVAHTGFHRPSGPTGGTLQLSLTLAIDNPSRRAAVVYESMFVDVSNSTAAVWDSWVRATVAPPMPMRQPRRRAVAVAATVDLVGPLAVEFTGNMTSSSFAVIVTAQARFKVGVAWTRLYDIKVSCAPVSFFPAAKASRHTGGGASSGAGDGLPVKCV